MLAGLLAVCLDDASQGFQLQAKAMPSVYQADHSLPLKCCGMHELKLAYS